MPKLKSGKKGKAQRVAIMLAEEERKIKELLEQCGMLCEAIQMTCHTTFREEENKSKGAYYDAKRQKEKREKEQKELAI